MCRVWTAQSLCPAALEGVPCAETQASASASAVLVSLAATSEGGLGDQRLTRASAELETLAPLAQASASAVLDSLAATSEGGPSDQTQTHVSAELEALAPLAEAP